MATVNSNLKKSNKENNEQEPLSLLIDPTFFVINFVERKFLSIGLDPVDNFNVTSRIITPSSYLLITPQTLQQIFTITRDILPTLLDTQLKTKTSKCIVDDTILLSKITRRGDVQLVFQSTYNSGKVLLSRQDLIALQHVERSALDSISLKTKIIRPVVLRQLEQIAVYLKSNYPYADTIEDGLLVIKDVLHEALISLIPNEETCFVSQLKLYADRQIAEKWMSAPRGQTIKVIKNISI